MHNPRMVDPEYELCREIKALTAKRKKTDNDLQAIAKLEWHGGLYHNGVEVVQPTSKIKKCLVNTGKITRMGTAVQRAIAFNNLEEPLVYDGPTGIDELFADKRFHSRLSVGIGGKRVMRVRPQFLTWTLIADGFFVPDAGLNWEDLEKIIDHAGFVEGIGDGRSIGYGKFNGVVEKLKD
jgi:hypothetical protein